jgi:predicted nucleic acid-binding protein
VTAPAPRPRLLDTNILLRHLTRDDPEKADRALTLLERVARSQERVVTTPMVVFETIFTLQRTYRVPRARIREQLVAVLALRGVVLPGKRRYRRALDLYVQYPNLSFADAFNVASMEASRLTEIYSWDTDFDGLPGITRIEPPLPPRDESNS